MKMCPSKRKALLSSLGNIDPSYDRLILFDIDKYDIYCLPPLMAFQLPISIKNIYIHQCIIYEGVYICDMSSQVWNKLGSLELVSSTISLHAYDGRNSQPKGLY
jgi:hypothetical protein